MLWASSEECVSLYFGVGCFWHIQYEFIHAEETILKRHGANLTSITGYAASTGDRFCYKDGKDHAEVVDLVVPRSAVFDIAAAYWKMFVGKDRSHTGDKGPNYRAVIGLPGGMQSPLIADIKASQEGNVAQTFELRAGSGDDPDTLGSAHVWVYDSNVFPFRQAELYHQFHDDYLPGGNYEESYNSLKYTLLCSGRLSPTQCLMERPDDKRPCDGNFLPSANCSVGAARNHSVSSDASRAGQTTLTSTLASAFLTSTPLMAWAHAAVQVSLFSLLPCLNLW